MSNNSSDQTGVTTGSEARKGHGKLFQKGMLLTASLCLLGGGIFFVANGLQPAGQTEARTSVTGPTVSPSQIASAAPTVEAVAPAPVAEAPVAPAPAVSFPASTLNIPSVGISTSIVSGGESNGSMVLPESSKVAEFSGAASLTSPKGSTVIAGHVNFADNSPGALGPLSNVTPGATIYATDAAGTVHEFRATKVDVLHKQALPSALFRTAGAKQLVVVTCGGPLEIVNGAWAYTHNFVVTAEAV